MRFNVKLLKTPIMAIFFFIVLLVLVLSFFQLYSASKHDLPSIRALNWLQTPVVAMTGHWDFNTRLANAPMHMQEPVW